MTTTLNPFRELESLFSALDHVWSTAGATPGVNVHASDDAAIVTTELPGVAPGQVQVQIHEDVLTIAVGQEAAPATGTALLQERPALRFSRRVQLPFQVDGDRIEARLKDGVLGITLSRAASDRPRRIQVNPN